MARQATQEAEVAKQSANAFVSQVAQLAARAPAAVQPPPAADWFLLQPASALRDWITIKLENRSQTLTPILVVYDAEKTEMATVRGANAGANADYTFVVEPGADHFLQVGSSFASNIGAYALLPTLHRSLDAFEPNDDPLVAKPVGAGVPIDANIMDRRDVDWYRLSAFGGTAMTIRLDNGSTSLQPWVAVYDRNKKAIFTEEAGNQGQSLDLSLQVQAGQDYLVAAGSRWHASAGAYRLQVRAGN